MISAGDLMVDDVAFVMGRIEHLMQKYRDLPMDFADASLVAIAEENGWEDVFTLDGDFLVYRLGGRRAFNVVP
jgi:predicted nucleic acid-binding protein